MIKKTIKYVDYNDKEQNETFYFNLTRMELTKLNAKYKGGFELAVKNAVDAGDEAAIIDILDNVIASSVGVKSEDGSSFIKTPEITNKFINSPAYEELLMEILEKEGAADAFFTGVCPRNIQEKINASKK